jgi:hypothetical protein
MKALFLTFVVAVGLLLGFPSGTMANPHTGKPATYHFTLIADTSGPFQEIRPHFSINDRGAVSFTADLKAGGGGVFTGNGESIATIVNTRPSVYRGTTSINNAGTVAFDGWPVPAPVPGIYTASGGAITPIIANNEPLGYGFVSLNNKGAVAYRSTENLVAEDAIWLAVPGAAPKQLGIGLPPSINDRGVVVFVVRLERSSNDVFDDWAIVASNNGGPLVRVADTLGPFGPAYLYVAINDKGAVAYPAILEKGQAAEGNRGIVTVTDGRFTTVADNRGGPFRGFGPFVSINNKGAVAFDAALRSGETGIFTGPDPVADRVIAQGDPLLGSTVTKVDSYSREGLNDKGEVVFLATLADGRQVLVRACPVSSEQKHGAKGATLSFPL